MIKAVIYIQSLTLRPNFKDLYIVFDITIEMDKKGWEKEKKKTISI